MAGLQAIVLKDAIFTVAEEDYSTSVAQVVFIPQVRWGWQTSMCSPPSPYFIDVAWTCTVSYAQDLETPNSLTRFLMANAATPRTVLFTPKAGGPSVQADALLIPGQLGGVPNQPLSATVTLPLFDGPVVA